MSTWRPADFGGIAARLREVRSLLEQAAALEAATALERARTLGDLVGADPRGRAPVRVVPARPGEDLDE